MPVSFINALKVPLGREDEFRALWDEGASYVSGQPGFVATSLHRTVSANAPCDFYTVAVWETADRFAAATSTDWWRDYVRRFRSVVPGFAPSPAVCDIERDTQGLFQQVSSKLR
jgi:heme-degrading monooxygenase HmoA